MDGFVGSGVDGYVWTDEFDLSVLDFRVVSFCCCFCCCCCRCRCCRHIIRYFMCIVTRALAVSLSNVRIEPPDERSQSLTSGAYGIAFYMIGADNVYDKRRRCGMRVFMDGG